ncbi:MAG: hypothetical protein ACUVWK_02880 [Nitrososphaerales archaeon]
MSSISAYDVGSMPFVGELDKFLKGARGFYSILPLLYRIDHPSYEPMRYFEERVVRCFLDKLEAGIEIPNYPQFRDMNAMFLDSIDGIKKGDGGYSMVGSLSVRSNMARIPEVQSIKKNARILYEKMNNPFKAKICITGPYTLSSLFLDRRIGIFSELSEVLSGFVSNSIYKDKYSEVGLVSIDEPVFGFLSDPLIDYGTLGREDLLKAWERISHEAASRGVRSCLHLHNTSDDLFWEVDSLNIIESHVDDLIYESRGTRQVLERKDKFLKASICITDFDRLIRDKILKKSPGIDESMLMQEVEKVWADLKRNRIDPNEFLETVETMKRRLIKIVDSYGIERVPYAGPECGMRSFPTYGCALEYLKRVSDSIKD